MRNFLGALRALGATLALAASIEMAAQPVLAQVRPTAGNVQEQAQSQAPVGFTAPKWVYYDQIPDMHQNRDGTYTPPLATRYQNFSRDTPGATWGDCVASYGAAACYRIAMSNSDVCEVVASSLDDLHSVDLTLGTVDNDEAVLLEIYKQLPNEIRGATRVMMVSQAVSAGFLCVLSAGLYCIAAISSAIGNVSTAKASEDLQLTSIKLAILNIVTTKGNIRLEQISIRLNGAWVKFALPACVKAGYAGSADFPRLPPYNNPIPDFVTQPRSFLP